MNDFTTTYYTTSDKEKSMKAPTKRATRRLAASLAIATALATIGAYADTYYWDRATAVFTTANGWANLAGGTVSLLDNESFSTYLNDDFVVRPTKAITTGDKNANEHWFNTKSLTLEGTSSRFYYRGRSLYNCHFVLCGGSVLYCWGRSDRNDYWSVIYPSSSINVASSATRGTPAAINVSQTKLH